MSRSTTSNRTRRQGLLLTVLALIISLLTTGATAAVATASTKAPTPSAVAHQVFKSKSKSKKKSKPKPKPKKKPKKKAKKTTTTTRPKSTTTTTAPSTTQTTTETPPSGSVTITEDGSSLLLPLFQLWAQSYNKSYSNVTVNPAGGGSGKGQSDAASGVVNIGASDAYLSNSQFAATPGLENIALAISSQMIVTNIQGFGSSTHVNLTGSVISQIYQGKITYWDDPSIQKLNPNLNLPHEQIIALHRIDSSGDTFIFSQFLSGADPSGWGNSIGYGTTVSFPSIGNSLGENGNGGMVTGCNATPGCIAYIGISYQSQVFSDSMQESAVANASGNYELPTAASITSEAKALEASTPANEVLSMVYDNASDGYPIINYEYAIVQEHQSSSTEAAAIRSFLFWAIDPSAGSNNSFLSQVGFIPLTSGVQALTIAQIAKIS